jgi:hypothetical protein
MIESNCKEDRGRQDLTELFDYKHEETSPGDYRGETRTFVDLLLHEFSSAVGLEPMRLRSSV